MKHSLKVSIVLQCMIVCVIMLVHFADAQQILSQLQDTRKKLFLSLDEAINLVLQNNLEIRIQQYNPEIRNEEIKNAEAAFDSELSTESAQIFKEPSTQNSPQNITNLEVGFGKRFTTGGSYQIGLTTSRAGFGDIETTTTDPATGLSDTTTESPDAQYTTDINLTVSHALLKNRGTGVNTTQIMVTRKNREISLSELRAEVIKIVSRLKSRYWNLVFALGDLEAKRLSLQLAYDLVKINEAQVNVGTLAPIEVLQAKATAASREVDIINAEQTVRNREDGLKRLLNISEGEHAIWNSAIVPTDTPLSSPQPVSLEESILRALENREELMQLRKSIEIQEILLNASENQLSPELNVVGSFDLSGPDDNLGGTIGELVGFDTYSFRVGVNFSYPLGNNAARSDHNKTKLELDQRKLSLQNLEQLIMVQVRQAVRNVETSYKLVDATRIALQLAHEQLDAEQMKFQEGLSTNFQVLNYQEQLASSRSRHTQAITGYNQAIVVLDQLTGVTLQRHNIVISE